MSIPDPRRALRGRLPIVRPRPLSPSVFLGLALAAAPAAAQAEFHVSTTSSTTLAGETLDDSALLSVAAAMPNGSAAPFFTEGHWLAAWGFLPGDVDAFARRPGVPPGSASSFAFSLLSNEGGFADGDVLTFAPGGGVEVLVGEDDLTTALGLPGASIDVDAFDFDPLGCLFFSLQSDLAGTTIGDVLDGDVLCYDLASGDVWFERKEAEIEACFAMATGLGAAILDVQALDVVGGNLWIVPQAPSSHDGAVIVCTSSPFVAFEETHMGLGGAEIDALSVADPWDRLGVLRFDALEAAPGDAVTLTLRGEPDTTYIGLFSGAAGWIDFSHRGGFGAWYLDPLDPWLNSIVGMPAPPSARTDSAGHFTTSWSLPTSALWGLGMGGEDGWSFQAMELPSLRTTAPVRIGKL